MDIEAMNHIDAFVEKHLDGRAPVGSVGRTLICGSNLNESNLPVAERTSAASAHAGCRGPGEPDSPDAAQRGSLERTQPHLCRDCGSDGKSVGPRGCTVCRLTTIYTSRSVTSGVHCPGKIRLRFDPDVGGR